MYFLCLKITTHDHTTTHTHTHAPSNYLFFTHILSVPFLSLTCRHTPACSAWWSTRTKSCPSTPRRSWRSIKASSGTRYRHMYLPSQTPPIDRCCKVGRKSQSAIIAIQTDIGLGLWLMENQIPLAAATATNERNGEPLFCRWWWAMNEVGFRAPPKIRSVLSQFDSDNWVVLIFPPPLALIPYGICLNYLFCISVSLFVLVF